MYVLVSYKNLKNADKNPSNKYFMKMWEKEGGKYKTLWIKQLNHVITDWIEQKVARKIM